MGLLCVQPPYDKLIRIFISHKVGKNMDFINTYLDQYLNNFDFFQLFVKYP